MDDAFEFEDYDGIEPPYSAYRFLAGRKQMLHERHGAEAVALWAGYAWFLMVGIVGSFLVVESPGFGGAVLMPQFKCSEIKFNCSLFATFMSERYFILFLGRHCEVMNLACPSRRWSEDKIVIPKRARGPQIRCYAESLCSSHGGHRCDELERVYSAHSTP